MQPLPPNLTLKVILSDRRHMGGLGLTFVIHHKQKKRFVMSSEESTRGSTHALGRACAANNCYRKKNFYCYATTFNMNAAKSQQQSHFRLHNKNCQSTTPVTTSHQKQRTITICHSWHGVSVRKWNASVMPNCC